MHLAKRNSNVMMIENLQKLGYDVTFEEAMALTDGSDFNRAHVARLLMNKGYVASVGEAFDNLLKAGNGIYTPAKKITSIAAIRFIRAEPDLQGNAEIPAAGQGSRTGCD